MFPVIAVLVIVSDDSTREDIEEFFSIWAGNVFVYPYIFISSFALMISMSIIYWIYSNGYIKLNNYVNKKVNQGIKKQGSYGKVPTHSHSLFEQLSRPNEIKAAFKLLFVGTKSMNQLLSQGINIHVDDGFKKDLNFCNKMLHKVSRSFAGVIAQLENSDSVPMRIGVAVFYLALRALDTVEDEMELSKFNQFILQEDKKEESGTYLQQQVSAKCRLLVNFHQRFRSDEFKNELCDDFKLTEIGEGDENTLLANIGSLLRVFYSLPKKSQIVIADITEEMGKGMASFVERNLINGTTDMNDYDNYCHIVAGTVGDGLTRLWAAFELEDPSLVQQKKLWNDMGIFLQRTNITRDIFEDYADGRAFWPQSVYSQYIGKIKSGKSLSSKIDCFENDSNANCETQLLKQFLIDTPLPRKLYCLNHMITDAIELVPSVIDYLGKLQNPSIIRFCAVPQVMAIATLAECYNNPNVFTGVCKIRKGLAAMMLLDCCNDTDQLNDLRIGYQRWFSIMAVDIASRIRPDDPNATRTRLACAKIISMTEVNIISENEASEKIISVFRYLNVSAGLLFALASIWWFFLSGSWNNLNEGGTPRLDPGAAFKNENQTVIVAVYVITSAFLLAFAGFPFFLAGIKRNENIDPLAPAE